MAVLAVLVSVQSAVAQGKLEGVWKITEFIPADLNAKPIAATQLSLLIFTKKYFSVLLISGDKPRPDLPQKDATNAQKVATWTPFAAAAGTYEVKGTTYTVKTALAKDPSGMAPGNFETIDFKIEGNTLIVTPKATQDGPIANLGRTKLTRLE